MLSFWQQSLLHLFRAVFHKFYSIKLTHLSDKLSIPALWLDCCTPMLILLFPIITCQLVSINCHCLLNTCFIILFCSLSPGWAAALLPFQLCSIDLKTFSRFLKAICLNSCQKEGKRTLVFASCKHMLTSNTYTDGFVEAWVTECFLMCCPIGVSVFVLVDKLLLVTGI